MSGRIYLLNERSDFVAMEQAPYDSERLLQELLAKYPDLLAGEQINAHVPRRWLLVSREMSVPGEEDGAGRWSLDHLFLDQEAIPTLVEVKRSTDTRLRRSVVGQMLDYAANAVAYWPVEEVKARFERRCQSEGKDPDATLSAFVQELSTPEDFWQRVKTNLQAGRIRMVFLADEIPPELRRIVEFLNSQMDPAEILAVEVKQYVGEKVCTLVPRVIGQTAEAESKKGVPKVERRWDEPRFFDELARRAGGEAVLVARRIMEWCPNRMQRDFGKGGSTGSVFFEHLEGERPFRVLTIWTDGNVEISLQALRKSLPFSNDQKRREFVAELNKIPEVSFSEERIFGNPRIPLQQLNSDDMLDSLFAAIGWAIAQIKAAGGSDTRSLNST